ncbi:lipopolysaccharide assembly protein LapB [Wenzhouxiangella marina]|uniref:Lipopolysaccharide assembly protein B n=1 Tax=Wenzhouxiangella marina TaxID=1579979 RepID=A0A0K0XVK5_9GAMM|nr:lipopolysaccharide assembly protein LapB [Wenzhouxiangella marina]AKS41703.1 Heat shock protein [Wenzhouxiangella marina]MBB6086535.1 lipopolysaccharide biosynthesis regulator YciM [Wenzhouxiangella marina]
MAELALLFLLLPVAAATGWWVARRGERARRSRSSALSSSYFRGLNYLLNEQPDKAIEVFLELADINPDTVETHLALGNLFRRRGEMDKAIRFHKHIMTRPNLSDEQRALALYELGEDYMQAGLLDRAERLFRELAEHDSNNVVPTRQLLSIYQQEKDWEQAIEMARTLREDGPERGELIAQFQCEIAAQALNDNDTERARQALRQARRYDPRNPRARLLEGDLAWSMEDWSRAADHYRAACDLDADCLIQVLERIIECHRRVDDPDALDDWLQTVVERSPMTTPLIALAQRRAANDPQGAADLVLDRMARRPTVRGLKYLMSLLVSEGARLDRIDPALVGDLLDRLLSDQPLYRCQHCGFSGTSYHWLCPSCRRWNTTRAIRGILGE